MRIRKLYKLLVDCEKVVKKYKKKVKNKRKYEDLLDRIERNKKRLLKMDKTYFED